MTEDYTFYSVLSTLEMQHGGLTSASLRRARALYQEGKRSGVLVANYVPGFGELARTTDDHILCAGVEIRNMFYDIVRNPALLVDSNTSMEKFIESDSPRVESLTAGSVSVNRYYDTSGNIVIVESSSNTFPERRYTVYDPDSGMTVLSASNWELRRRWIRWVDAQRRSVFLIDGVSMGQALASVDMNASLKYLMLHGTHSRIDSDGKRHLHSSREIPFRYSRKFDRVVVQSETQKRDVREFVNNSVDVSVVPNVNTSSVAPVLESRPKVGIICTRLEEGQKRISHILEIAERVLAQSTDVSFEIYGEGQGEWASDRLSCRFRTVKGPDRILFHGFVENASEHYSRGLFTILTSRYEGFPLNLVEASAGGCIPIAYDIDYGPADLVRDGRNGFLIQDGDIDSVVERILELCSDEALASSMRKAATSVVDRFTPRAVVSVLTELAEKDFASQSI